ncbi:hypothetical protein F5Y09DRAFT_15348 [Xylaria sp. FL1042]|nr:hypothetical protein F5Y09DRAFT_15348 [Xylaria sp. FL1042]
MSDQSDREEDNMPSGVIDTSTEQDSDESETDQGDPSINGFFNMEAEESDSYDADEDEEDEEEDRYSYYGYPASFPQFSHLPPELRIAIWEAVDPYLKSKARVLPLHVVTKPPDIWETATLAYQTARARQLLAACRESRSIALPYYPDVIRIREGLGDVRFNSANDVILLHRAHQIKDIRVFGPWFGNVKYLAFEYPYTPLELYHSVNNLPDVCRNIEAIFQCFDASMLGHRLLDWSVSESSKQFYFNPSRGDAPNTLFCWPDTKLHKNFAECVGEDYVLQIPHLPPYSSVPVWPMALYSFDPDTLTTDLKLYGKVKRRHERSISRKAGSDSPLESSEASPNESSEGESFYESELDDYELDGFVVDNPSEGSEEPSEHEDSSDEDGGENNTGFNQDPDTFNGFSPIQDEPSDDESAGNLPNAAIINNDVESDEHSLSAAQSQQSRTMTQAGRRKRRIVSSDDEDNGEENSEETPREPRSRVQKRARVILSDSEGDEEGRGNSPVSETQGPSRLKQRAHIVLSDSEVDDEYGKEGEDEDSEDDENDEDGDDVTDDEDDEGGEERPVSKPVSLLARLRQFRSDVPVSPELESPKSSAEERDEEEQSEDEEEQGLSGAEFPDSAAEDYEEDGW